MNNLLTAGEFARLARTTKRTVLWYDTQGILKPTRLDSSNSYRLYAPSQIIDFQVILMLRKLDFSLEEINTYLTKNKKLEDLFKLKKILVKQEIDRLQKSLNDIDNYYKNLSVNGTLVRPETKIVKPFDIYYIYKEGPYSKIKDYSLELQSYLEASPTVQKFLTIFLERDYTPQKAKMKIGILIEPGTKVKTGFENRVLKETVPGYKALTFRHTGSGVLLSLLWLELDKFRRKMRIKQDNGLSFVDIEFYHDIRPQGFDEEENHPFEIQLPIL